MMFSLFLTLNCAWSLAYVNGYTMDDVKQLLNDTLDDYNKDIRPLKNQSEPLILKIATELPAIIEFDEVNQKLTYTSVMIMQWYDESMVWNPESYGGLDNFTISSRHFWTPSLMLTNTYESMKTIGESFSDVRIRYDGQINMAPGEVFSATCDPDVTYFPWDRHACVLLFVHWGTNKNEVLLVNVSNKVATHYYAENRDWKLEDTIVQIVDGDINSGGFYEVTLYLRRKPLFVIVNLILPAILMSFLNILAFLIPTATGERLSYSITILLAISVFFTIVGDDLPKISSPMAIFSYYLLGVLSMSCCVIFATLFSLNIYHKDEKNTINNFWKTIVEKFNRKSKTSSVVPVMFIEQSEQNGTDDSNKTMPQSKKECTETPVELYRDEVPDKLTWKECSGVFDNVCFILFSVIQAFATIIFFTALYAAAN